MNIERLLEIALEADKMGDYVTADKVDNLLKTAQMPAMPQMNQQMPQQGGVYNPGMAPGAVYFNGATFKKPQPQMTEEQKAFAKLRGTGIYNSLARSRGVMDQRLQAIADAEKKAKQSRINYGPAATPRFLEGTNTQAEYVPNPNTPINPKLYGSGYASMAMAPQQPMLQQPQAQQSYQNLNNYSYNQNYNTPANQNYYNNAMMQQQQQQSFPQANQTGNFYFESDNGGPIDQSMNVAFGTQNNSANYKDGNPNMTSSR